MIKTRIKLERTPIVEGIEIPEIRKLRWNGKESSPIGLTVENLDFMTKELKGRSQIGQSDRLCPNGGSIEVLNGRLDEENLHSFLAKAEGGHR
jgi:hypothetical protein